MNDLYDLAVRTLRKVGTNAFVTVLSVIVFVGLFLIDLPGGPFSMFIKIFLVIVIPVSVFLFLRSRSNSGSHTFPGDADNRTDAARRSETVVFMGREGESGGEERSDPVQVSVIKPDDTTGTSGKDFEDSVQLANRLKQDTATESEEDSADYDIRSLKMADVETRLDSEQSFRRFLVNIIHTIKSEFAAHSSFFFLVNHVERACVVKVSLSDSEHFFSERAIFYDKAEADILQTVIQEKCPLLISDLDEKFSGLPYYTGVEEIKSICIVPVVLNGVVIGLLGIDNRRKGSYKDQDVEVLTSHAKLIEEFIGNVEHVYRCENALNTISSLFDISEHLNAKLRTADIVELLKRVLPQSIKFDRAVVSLKHRKEPIATVEAVLGEANGVKTRSDFGLKGSLNGSLIKNREPIYIRDLSRQDRYFPRFNEAEEEKEVFKSFFGLPMAIHGECFGAFSLESRLPDAFDKTQRQFGIILANVVSQALERAALYDDLATLAEHDGLTGLLNHRTFLDRLAHEIERTKRSGVSFSLLMMDIDHFKKFNDTYGHQVGDFVLNQVASVIRSSVRIVDIVGRYGGEEFVVILIEQTKKQAEMTGERIRTNVERHLFDDGENQYHVTISVGISETNVDAPDRHGLVKAADEAMYQAKMAGRNRVVLFDNDRANA